MQTKLLKVHNAYGQEVWVNPMEIGIIAPGQNGKAILGIGDLRLQTAEPMTIAQKINRAQKRLIRQAVG